MAEFGEYTSIRAYTTKSGARPSKVYINLWAHPELHVYAVASIDQRRNGPGRQGPRRQYEVIVDRIPPGYDVSTQREIRTAVAAEAEVALAHWLAETAPYRNLDNVSWDELTKFASGARTRNPAPAVRRWETPRMQPRRRSPRRKLSRAIEPQ